jgi:hypothetical protein
MNEKRRIKCSGCDCKLQIPAEKRKLEVRCPACGARFFWELGNNQPDSNKLNTADYQRTLNAVCAGKKRFKIVFGKQRSDPYYRFSHNEPIHSYRFSDESDDFSSSLWDEEESFSQKEFFFTYDCFHCHNKEQYVYCSNCNHFICGSQKSTDWKGNKYVYCPICDSKGAISYTECRYSGSTSDLRKPKEEIQIPTPQKQKLGAGAARSNFRALPPKK